MQTAQLDSGEAACAMLEISDMSVQHDSRLRHRFGKEVGALGLPSRKLPRKLFTEEHAAALPATVRRYLRFMGAIGRTRDWSLRVGFRGELRRTADEAWLPCEGWMYDTSFGIARYCQMQVSTAGVLMTMVRGSYSLGRGRMQAKLLDLIPIVDLHGPETDRDELVSYLDDALLFAPAMIVGPNARWTGVGDRSFDVSLTDQEITVTTRVHIDARGAPTLVSTNDHYVVGPLLRTKTSMHLDEWTTHQGRPVPSHVRTVRHLAGGPSECARYEFVGHEFDVPPGD